jgi:hypothetical protein
MNSLEVLLTRGPLLPLMVREQKRPRHHGQNHDHHEHNQQFDQREPGSATSPRTQKPVRPVPRCLAKP